MKLPKGEYYIGDPCNAIKDNEIESFVSNTLGKNTEWLIHTYKNNKIACGYTFDLDGVFTDNFNNTYKVCMGILAILPIDVVDHYKLKCFSNDADYLIINFLEDFFVYKNDKVFMIGDHVINTSDYEIDIDIL